MTRAGHEQNDSEDPRDALLNLLDEALRAAVCHGCEAQALAIVEKHLSVVRKAASLPAAMAEPEGPADTVEPSQKNASALPAMSETDARKAYEAALKARCRALLQQLAPAGRINLETTFERSLPAIQAAVFRKRRGWADAVVWAEAREFLRRHLDLGELADEAGWIGRAMEGDLGCAGREVGQ